LMPVRGVRLTGFAILGTEMPRASWGTRVT
jgi:hypothetical protein